MPHHPLPALRAGLSLILLMLVVPMAHALSWQQGQAYAAKGGQLLYTETHWRYQRDGRAQHLVLYRCADGQPFARKRLQQVGPAQAPDFHFEDGRDGYAEGVRSVAGGREVYVRDGKGSEPRRSTLPVPADGVIDAGFDDAVRARRARLAAGQPVTLPFLLPSRQVFVPVRLQGQGTTTWQGQPAQRLRLSLDRWFGFVAPPIELLYASSDGRLLQFSGIGTIRDARGRNQPVRIEFPKPATNQGVDPDDMADAASVALTGRCE